MRFGLIGTGFWADTVHAAGIAAHPQAELVGVWGRNPTKAASVAARHAARPFADVDELIGAVEAVAFAVPPDLQAELAVRAAEAGRSLLLEKPLALSVEAAEAVVRAARAPTVVFFTRRFDPGIRSWFQNEVDGHDWIGGSVVWLASIFEPGNPFGTSEWRREHGALWDLGPHALAWLVPTLGPVEQVEAVRGRGDEVHLALRHASGAASSVTVSLTAPAHLEETRFWGSEGLARRGGGSMSQLPMPLRSTRCSPARGASMRPSHATSSVSWPPPRNGCQVRRRGRRPTRRASMRRGLPLPRHRRELG